MSAGNCGIDLEWSEVVYFGFLPKYMVDIKTKDGEFKEYGLCRSQSKLLQCTVPSDVLTSFPYELS
jgi:hypothetical protein